MKITKKKIEYVVGFLLMYLLYSLLNEPGSEKYFVACMILCFFAILGRKRRFSMLEAVAICLPTLTYLLLGLLNVMIHGTAQTETIKVIIYNLLPLILAFVLYVFYGKSMREIVDAQFICSSIYYIFLNNEFWGSWLEWESTFAFVFCIFTIYYAYRKKCLYLLISIILMCLGKKRIAIMAAFLAILLMGVFWLFKKNKKLVIAVWVTITTAVLSYICLIYTGILEYYCWGFDVNTNGRLKMYNQVIENYSMFRGEGIGIIENLLKSMNIPDFLNLHNDLLKLYIELGAVGFLLYFASYLISFLLIEKASGKSAMCIATVLAGSSMMLFATDNVSIYILYLFPLYSVLFAIIASERKEDYS